MLIAVVACVLGIILENYKWPQDRSALQARFIESDEIGEKLSLLIGLVLNHSVVRWLIAFAVAATIVPALFLIPSLNAAVHQAVDEGRLGNATLDALIWSSVSVVMALLSFAARRIAG